MCRLRTALGSTFLALMLGACGGGARSEPAVQREAVATLPPPPPSSPAAPSRPSTPASPQLFVQVVAGEALIIGHVLPLTDAISAMLARPEADRDRIGLIGFSLGAATAMTFIASQPRGTVKALGNFFGFLTDTIRNEVSRFPPTIMLHNTNDQIVPVANSRDLDRLIPAAIAHRFVEYDERWQDVNHAFEPGGLADTSSRSEATKWFVKHLPPTGTEP